MNKPETRLRNSILKRLRVEWPGYWVHIHGNAYTPAGIPDIVGCYKGRFYSFEVKTPGGGDATNLQEYNLEQIKRSGGVAAMIRSYEEANAILVEVVARRAAERVRRSQHIVRQTPRSDQ